MSAQQEIGTLLGSAIPTFSAAEAEALARDTFGLRGVASPLSGERDSNFYLRVGDAEHYVLKVAHPAEDRQVTNFQTEALLHIAAAVPSLPVPRVLKTRAGETEWLLRRPGEDARVVRVLTFLLGEPLHRAPASALQRRNLGSLLAKLDLGLRDFSHPASDHELMWDMKHASRLRDLLVHIADPQRRGLAGRFLDNFEAHALPAFAHLRAQVIHNDLNPHNVLVYPDDPDRIAGIIDFGDMVHAPLINNLAVAAAYHPTDSGHPLEAMADLVRAYHAELPLQGEEIDILFDLIATRMVLTVTISGWRAARYPENRDYILRNNSKAWAGLERLSSLPRREAQAYLHRICRGE